MRQTRLIAMAQSSAGGQSGPGSEPIHAAAGLPRLLAAATAGRGEPTGPDRAGSGPRLPAPGFDLGGHSRRPGMAKFRGASLIEEVATAA